MRLAAILVALAPAAAGAGELPLFDRVVELVRQNHDPAQVRGPELVTFAFQAWARADERLEVHADPPDRPTALLLRTGGGTVRLDLAGVRTFAQAASTIRVGIDRVAAQGLALGSSEPRLVDGLLLALDPHCALLPPGSIGEAAADVGLRVGHAAGRAIVREVLPGGAGARAGLAEGTAIVAVEGESTLGVPADRVADRLRGPAGSTVEVTLDVAGKRRVLSLERDVGGSPLVSRARVDGAAYVRLTRFGAGAAQAVREAIAALRKEGPVPGIVLDLRGNPGGLVDEAVNLADLFLEKGLIVETVGYGGRIRESRSAQPGSLALPLVVLIDGDTASAAEIVSGALHLQGRAVLAGDRSYGKGTVQVLYELTGGWGLKLTVAEYRLDRGTSLRGTGLTPDAPLRALRGGGPEPSGFAPTDLAGAEALAAPLYVARSDPARDPLVRAAAHAILTTGTRLQSLRARLRAEVAAAATHEEPAVARELAAYGADWSAGGAARPRVSIEVTATRLAGERVDLQLVLRSAGPAASRLRVWTRSAWLPLDRRELAVGHLAAGQVFRGHLAFDAAGPRPARLPVTLHVDGDAGSVLERTVVVDVPGALSAGN